MGLWSQWNEVLDMYRDVNKLLGDVVKVTPSSKVVGDLALYLFEKLISRASLSATGNQNYESEFDTIPFIKNTIEALASRHNAHTLANFHQAFCSEIRQAERLFLDFTPIFANFLCKLHSQTLPE